MQLVLLSVIIYQRPTTREQWMGTAASEQRLLFVDGAVTHMDLSYPLCPLPLLSTQVSSSLLRQLYVVHGCRV